MAIRQGFSRQACLAGPPEPQLARGFGDEVFPRMLFEMILYRVLRDVQFRADFFIGEPRSQQLKHLFLSFREIIDRSGFGMF